ncbi:M1 family metallopeptidase [Cellulomonas sp. PhB143]|uniref:M1 family metallopeptidase n=1 Tax=Cellulomonas sp. PhB143 TaxID=2485186 RepID=UPI000F47E905|nr:M1 family metallopeptidase [Cellulomonas sp. PhB143]ROS76656.1 peptidase M1-like protein [Cellulomonas sp. PhB143]
MLPSRATAPDPYVPHHGARDFVVDHYGLRLRYRVEPNRLEGVATLDVRALERLEDVHLDLVGLRVSRVEVDGERVRYAQKRHGLRVRTPRPLEAGGTATVEVSYAGNPSPAGGPWGDVGWEELSAGVLVAGQPTGAPTWFPCNDHPGYKATYDLTITTDSPYTVVANAPVHRVTRRASTRTWTFERTEPMCTYLATVQVGPYDTGRLGRHAHVARTADAADDVAHDLDRHDELFGLFEDLFGPYPFASYTVVVTPDDLEIPLEAHGASVFGANHLDGSRGSDRLVAHELAHQWFGNSVSVRTWRDIWLNEGFACYAEWLWAEASGGPDADDLAHEHHTRLAQLPQDLVLSDPGPELMFDDRVYKRGALTLHTLRLTLGDDAFFALLRTWTERHRHGHATTDDLRALVRESAGAAGSPAGAADDLLDRWLDETALPGLPARDAARRSIRGRAGRRP